jgi:hypothetical protein
MIPRGEKAEDGRWYFFMKNLPQAYRIFREKPKNPRVGYGEQSSVHLQLLQLMTKQLLLEGWYVSLDLGEEARKLPDIIAYYPKSSREWIGPVAYECESDPIKHPRLVRENLAKGRDMSIVWLRFVTANEYMDRRIKEIIAEELEAKPNQPEVCDQTIFFNIVNEKKPSSEGRVPLSADAQLQKIDDFRRRGFHDRVHPLKGQIYISERKSMDGRPVEKGAGKVTDELLKLLEERGDPLVEMIKRKTQPPHAGPKHVKVVKRQCISVRK